MLKYLVVLAFLSNLVYAKTVNITLTENNSIVFNQQVSSQYVSQKTLEVMDKSLKASPLYLVLDTPGGSVDAGLKFIDAIKSLGIPVHTITLFAASMGYQMVQELGTRYIIPSGTLMSHRGAVGGISGQVPGELNSRVNHISMILDGMAARASKRVGMSKKAYEALIVNELWLDGVNSVSTGHADYLANVKCDKKLLAGSYEEEVNTLFGSALLKFSKCPLISDPIGVSFEKGVKPENFDKIKQLIKFKTRKLDLNF